MTAPTGKTRAQENKRLHCVMRDGALVEGTIFIAEDMSLVAFLGSRKGGWVNMVEARRPKLQEAPGHMILQSDLVVMVLAPDGNMQVLGQSAAGSGEREVEFHLVGGKTVKGIMHLAPMQRMSDYLSHSGKFVGITNASLHPDGVEIGDVAVNTGAIAMLREAKPVEGQGQ